MAFTLVVGIAIVGVGASARRKDHSAAFTRCLVKGGGSIVTRPSQLARVPDAGPQYGSGAGLGSSEFTSLDVAAPHGARQAVVIVGAQRPRTASALLRRAKADPVQFRAVVLLPPDTEDWERPISPCMDRVSPDDWYP